MKIVKKTAICKCGQCAESEFAIGLSLEVDTKEDLLILNAVLKALDVAIVAAGGTIAIEDEIAADPNAAISQFIN